MPSIQETAESLVRRGLPYSIFDSEADYQQTKQWIANEIEKALRDRDERAAKIADGVEEEWLTNARNVARASDIVGGLAQSTYTSYAEVAGKIAAAIRKED